MMPTDPVVQYVEALVNSSGNTTQNTKPIWPQQDDLAMSKKYDSTYGSPHAPYAQPESAFVRTTPSDQIPPWFNENSLMPPENLITGKLNNQKDADIARQQFIAAEKSAMAKLGWDPGLNITSNDGRRAPVNGMYSPKSNVSWNDARLPGAAMHEAMHRSFKLLVDQNKLPKGFDKTNEELYVRALMQKAYGPVEFEEEAKSIPGYKPVPMSPGYQQMVKGRKMMNDPIIQELENIAAQEVARKHPRGPR